MSAQTKNPWEEYPEIWPTMAKFMAWVRGGIRSGLWKKHPVKLEFLKESAYYIVNTNPRSMKRFPQVPRVRCVACSGEFAKDAVEVDHIHGNHSLKSIEDVQQFIESMIMVSKEDLQILCKPCHKIKSYAERQGMSFQEACAIKKAIQICNDKQDKSFLTERGITPASNATARRKQIEDVLTKETQ